MSTVVLHLFGSPHLACGSRRNDLPLGAPTGLLTRLGIEGDWVSREQLALQFWPDAGTSDAHRLLRVTLFRARALLRNVGLDPALVADRLRLRLDLHSDVSGFRQAVAERRWADALSLHRAPLLGGQHLRGFTEMDRWLSRQRDALLADWRAAALHEARRLAEQGAARQAVALLQAQLQSDLLAEDVVQALLQIATAADARVPALTEFDRFCTSLQAELGLAPLPATLAMARALRQHAPLPLGPALPRRLGLPRQRTALLVGRDAELQALREAGRGLCVVRGEAGLGKTSLVQAMVADQDPGDRQPVLWLQGREDWMGSPLLAVSHMMVNARTGAPVPVGSQTPSAASGMASLFAGLPLAPATAALLAGLVGSHTAAHDHHLPVGPAAAVVADDGALVGAVSDFLCVWPHAIVVDDLHWLDDESCHALALALASDTPPRVLATVRDADVSPALRQWLQRVDDAGRLSQLVMPPLPPAAVERLVAQATGHESPGFAAWLVERTGGNPFFTLECLASMPAEPLDDLPTSAWVLAVPARVTGVLQRRIEQLGEATQRVLTLAAAVGDARPLDVLAEGAGLSAWATAQALAEAQQAGLLRGREFAHGLVRDWLQQQTPEPLRVVVHAGLAKRLADTLTPHQLAAHWWAAAQPTRAVDATLAAAALDATQGLYAAAERLLGDALRRLPAGHDDDAARLDVQRACTARQQDDLVAAECCLAQALARLPMPATQQRAWGERFELALLRGQLGEAADCLAQARALGPDLPTLWLDAAKLAHAQGDAAACAESMAPYVAWLRRRPPGADLAGALTGQGVALDMMGQHDKARPLHEEALAITRRIGARATECEVMNNLVVCLGEMGRDDDAVRQGLPLLTALAAEGRPLPSTLAVNVAYSLLTMGRLAEAEPLYRRLARSELSSVACAASGKLLEIRARQGAGEEAVRAAVDATFEAMAATEMYTVQVSAMLAVLNHGRAADAPRVLPWLRDESLPAGLQVRLDQALHGRGLSGLTSAA